MAGIALQIATETSTYKAFKITVEQIVPLDRDTIHVLIGAIILAACLLLKRGPLRRAAVTALIFAFALGVAMEVLDARDDMAKFGDWRVKASLLDLLRTISIPLLGLVLIVRRHPSGSSKTGPSRR